LAAFATRILTTVFAGILIASPVAGLRPIRAFLFTRTSFPMPGYLDKGDYRKPGILIPPPAFAPLWLVCWRESNEQHFCTFDPAILACILARFPEQTR
jgi:hypothetical protein